jgi:hypothetical protein
MTEENKDKWLSWLSLVTVMLALGATLSTLRVGNFSNRSILKQTQASNQWSYYQAKSIKGYLYELQREKIEMDLKTLPASAPKELADAMQKKIQDYTAEINRYDQEKKEIQASAKKLEEERDQAQKHSQAFGFAVIFLQLAILLSSIAALMKKKPVWLLGMALGALGVACFVNGFYLIY